MAPTATHRGGFAKDEDKLGVVFIKQPKTGGETLAEILAQYSSKYGRKQLHDRSCYPSKNKMAQATCACNWHFVREDPMALPDFDPKAAPRCSVLYTHMYYNPRVLEHFMPRQAAVRLITIIRAPLDVLKSAQKMALVQHHAKGSERRLNNSFCQPLADDTDAWLSRCPMASTGDGSILMYLDPAAHGDLQALLARTKRTLEAVDTRLALGIMTRAVRRLENDFLVGAQASFDASLLLFEQVLGWDRADTLYSSVSMVKHGYNSPLSTRLDEEWARRRPEIEALLRARYAPLEFHQRLYEKGLQVHALQVRQHLGGGERVEAAVAAFRAQNEKFTQCYEAHHQRSGFDVCTAGVRSTGKGRPRSCFFRVLAAQPCRRRLSSRHVFCCDLFPIRGWSGPPRPVGPAP